MAALPFPDRGFGRVGELSDWDSLVERCVERFITEYD
jgi:hypothetical protein